MGGEAFAIDFCGIDRTKLLKPSKGAIDQEETGAENAFLTGCGNVGSVAVKFEAVEPIFSSCITMTTVKCIESNVLEEELRNERNGGGHRDVRKGLVQSSRSLGSRVLRRQRNRRNGVVALNVRKAGLE
ncbi:hypothetical protein EC968_009779 [Mortierella alpina]|nr:hypothetical protein EC968_009779 [Mortierella alpina]